MLISNGQVMVWSTAEQDFVPSDIGDIGGNLAVGQFNDGTAASAASFWRGDGVWAVPTAGDVNGLADPGGNGIVVRTASSTTVARSIIAPAAGFTISNGDGVSGNPTFALSNDLAALEALTGTGFPKRTGVDTWSLGTLVVGDIPDLSGTYQSLNAKLTSIGALANAAGWLHNDGAGLFAYSTPTKTDVGLGNVTNDAQTKASIVPNTLPSSGQVLVGNAGGSAYAPVSATGDVTISDAGVTAIGAAKVTTTMLNSNVFANPSAVIGLTAINGSAGTAMRSDAAPALSVAISPTWSGDHRFDGAVIFNTSGNQIDPLTNYDQNLGQLSKKYLTIHAAELWVETLVAQSTSATIGGRILVGTTTTLVYDQPAAQTYISVKHDNLSNGDIIYLESDGKVEFMLVTSAANPVSTWFDYTVTRNLDGSGANQWYAGDAVFNTGQTGNGFIDLYSVRGVKASSEVGPTIVGNVRNSATYNDWSPRWAIGNLNGLYGYGVTTFGVALGVPSAAHILIDPTNGIRIRHGSTDKIVLDASGNASFTGALSAATGTFTGDLTGSSMALTGKLTMSGAASAIATGTTPPTSATVGTGLWLDRTGMYGLASNVQQVIFDAATGKITAGAGNVILDAQGMSIKATSTKVNTNSLKLLNSTGVLLSSIYALHSADNRNLTLDVEGDGVNASSLNIFVGRSATSASSFTVNTTSSLGTVDLQLTDDGSNIPHAELYGTNFNGLIVGANSTPNAMLDVRGDTVITGSLGMGITSSLGGYIHIQKAVTSNVQVLVENTSNANGAQANFRAKNDAGTLTQMGIYGSGMTAYGAIGSGESYQYSTASLTLMADNASGVIKFAAGGNATDMTLAADGGLVIGAPTGGTKGAGSINAVTVWRNGTSLDRVFEPGYELMPIPLMREFYEKHHHLPTIPHTVHDEGSTDIGALQDATWETVEVHAVYLAQLEQRIQQLENQLRSQR